MIVAGEGGRERVEGKVWKGGRGKGGLWYGTTDFPHIYHVHSLIGIFAHKWKFSWTLRQKGLHYWLCSTLQPVGLLGLREVFISNVNPAGLPEERIWKGTDECSLTLVFNASRNCYSGDWQSYSWKWLMTMSIASNDQTNKWNKQRKQSNKKKKKKRQETTKQNHQWRCRWYFHLATVEASCVQHLCLTVHCCAYCLRHTQSANIAMQGLFLCCVIEHFTIPRENNSRLNFNC